MAQCTYSSVVPTVVSSSTSALASHNERLYSLPSKTKSVSFLLHDTYDPRRRYSGSDSARGWKHQAEDGVSTTATFPRRVVRRSVAYERVKKEDFLAANCACGSTSAASFHFEGLPAASKTMTPERKYIGLAEMDDFEPQRSFDGGDDRESQVAEIHAVAIERLPACRICAMGDGAAAALNENVYYIKDGVCENCACDACSYTMSTSHFECGRPYGAYEGRQYAYATGSGCCEQNARGFENSDEEVAISTSGDVLYQSTIRTQDDSRRKSSFASYTKFLWPCMNRMQREISVSPPLPPPPPPPPPLSSSQETLSTRFPASSSSPKSKTTIDDGVDERKKLPIRYSVISYSSSSSAVDGRCFKIPKRTIFVFVLCIAAVFGLTTKSMLHADTLDDRLQRMNFVHQLLNETILVDGHNDLPWNIRMFKHNLINKQNYYDQNLKLVHPWNTSSWSHTDLPRLRLGRIGAQIWSAFTSCESQFKDAVQMSLEQIDVILRFTELYSSMFNLCLSYKDVIETNKQRKVCSMITLEGGHNIANSLAVLRSFYRLGVRSMALTQKDCSTPWAESAASERWQQGNRTKRRGLSKFGITVINELNRLGIVIDLSGASALTMKQALNATKAPVVFSHSNSRFLCNVTQNVPEDVIPHLVRNKGVIMVTFYPAYLSCKNEATISNVIDHINYLKNKAGVDHIGIGSGFDGIDSVPNNLNDTSYFPELFIELTAPSNPVKWEPDELKKLAGLNVLRVLRDVEKVRDEMKSKLPLEDKFSRVGSSHQYDPEMRLCISHNYILN